jgi:predicted amidohydrolase YtcJ
MKITTLLQASALLLLSLFFACSSPSASQAGADLVIYGGTIYTMDSEQPIAEAVAVTDGKISYVGPRSGLDKLKGSNTQEIDLQGQTMTPGLIESHAHFMGIGQLRQELDLTDIQNYEELIERVEAAIEEAEPGEWITGRGWHQSKWDKKPARMVRGFQTHHALSAISPDNPVYLRHASGHAGFANAKAMEIAGITSESTYDERGEILKDKQGEPIGIFNENAMFLITQHIPEASEKRRREMFELAEQECLSKGITSFHDAGAGRETLALYQEKKDAGELDIRLYTMLDGWDTTLLAEWYPKGPQVDEWLSIRAIKLYSDGALGSRGAWLLAPYTDRPGHVGHERQPMERIGRIAQKGLETGFQVCVHAIGDRANREVLDQFEKAFEAVPEAKDHRFRIEHAQHINGEDIPRFGKMGVIASMQAIHMASDRPWAIDRLGIDRIVDGAYVWQKLLQTGARVINGTDAPVEPVDPIPCFYASVTRKTLKGEPDDGYEPDQRMTREEALRSYTLDAAYGSFEEDVKGSIEVGKMADFTVFDKDLLLVADDQILSTQVTHTIVGGELKYQKAGE